MLNKFFVYGTLMSGMPNHKVIPNQVIKNIRVAKISDMKLYAHESERFPCMVEGNKPVIGELITIKEKYINLVLEMTDQLEGFDEERSDEDNFYNRKVKTVLLEDGTKTEAYVYIYNAEYGLGENIKIGSWRIWKSLKQLKS